MKKRILLILCILWSFLLLSALWITDFFFSKFSNWWAAHEGLGGGITTPSFTDNPMLWIVLMIILLGIGAYFMGKPLWKTLRTKKDGKAEKKVVAGEKKEEKPKKKKDEEFHFFPKVGLVLYWPALIALYIVCVTSAYDLLRPHIAYGIAGLTNLELRQMIYAVVGLVFIIQCWTLVAVHKKGPRPGAFTAGYGVLILGIPAMVFLFNRHQDIVEDIWSRVQFFL